MNLLEKYDALNWRNPNIVYEKLTRKQFITNEEMQNSYIFKGLDKEVTKTDPVKNDAKKPAKKVKNQPAVAAEAEPSSCLTKVEQDICLKAIQIMQSNCEFNKLTMDEKKLIEKFYQKRMLINNENRLFLSYAKSKWTRLLAKKCSKLSPKVIEAHEIMWKEKNKNVINYPKYYYKCTTIPLTFDETNHIDMQFIENILTAESLPVFEGISAYNQKTLNNLDKNFNVTSTKIKSAVSQDRLSIELVKQNNFDLVISSSSFKKILDNHGPNYSTEWEIPVVIKKVESTESCSNKFIIFIDKPLTPTQTNQYKLKQNCFKRTLRRMLKKSNSKDTLDMTNDSSSGDNVTYSKWKMYFKDDKNLLMKNKHMQEEYSILVRCKIDALQNKEDGSLQPVVVLPKLENQFNFGANLSTPSELNTQWASLFLRPNSILCRARIDCVNLKVQMCETLCIGNIVNESMHCYNFIPNLKLGILHNVLMELKKMKPGNYILRHTKKDGAFITVLKETLPDKNNPNIYDLHSAYADENYAINDEMVPWCPIDVNLILNRNITQRTMPGMFRPKIKIAKPTGAIKGRKGTKKSKKSKKKKKLLLQSTQPILNTVI